MVKIITIIIASCSVATINSMNIPQQPPPPAPLNSITENDKLIYQDMQKKVGYDAACKAMQTKYTHNIIIATLGTPPPPAKKTGTSPQPPLPPMPRPASPKKLAASPVSAALATLRDSLDAVNTNVSNLAQQLNALRKKLTNDATPVENSTQPAPNPLLSQITQGIKLKKPQDKDATPVENATKANPNTLLDQIKARKKLKSISSDTGTPDEEKSVSNTGTPAGEQPAVAIVNSQSLLNKFKSKDLQEISEPDKTTLKGYYDIETLKTQNPDLYDKLKKQGYNDKAIEPYLSQPVDDDEW